MTPISAPQREATAIGVIGAAHFVSHFYHLVLPPLFLLIHEELGISYAQLGVVMTTYFFATLVTQVPIGLLVDSIGAKLVLTLGLVLHGGAVIAAGMAPSFEMLLVAFFVGGVANSVFHPADFSILSASVDEARHGRAFAIHTFTGSIGYALAPLTMAGLAYEFGWQTALIIAGSLGLICSVIVTFAWPVLSDDASTSRDNPPGEKTTWRFMLSRPMLLFFFFYVVTSASGTGMTNFAPVAITAIYGIEISLATKILTVFLIAAILGSLPGGWAAEKTKRENLLIIISFLIMAICLAVIGTGVIGLWAVFSGMALAGFLRGFYNASRDILVRQAAPQGRVGAAFGFVTLGYTIGQGCMPVVYGWFMDQGSEKAVFLIAAAFAMLAVFTVLFPIRNWLGVNH